MKSVKILVILTLFLLPFFHSSPVYAINPPTDTPEIISAEAFQSSVSENDTGILAEYNIPYTTNPDELASEAYIGVLRYGSTQVASVRPVAFFDEGYGYGALWFYFDPGVITWGSSNYTLTIEGNPGLSWNGTRPVSSAVPINFSPSLELPDSIIALARDLQARWVVDMVDDATDRLTETYGESYFNQVIPGLRYLAPSVLAITTTDPQYVRVSHGLAYATDLEARLAGSGFDTALVALTSLLHMPSVGWTSGIIMIAFALTLGLFLSYLIGTTRVAMPSTYLVLVAGLFTGLTPWQLIATWWSLSGLAAIYIIFLKQ